jgi:hypothetical protein
LIGLALFVRHYLAAPGSQPGLRALVTAIGFALAGAVTGKIVGLTWPRWLPARD